MTWLRRYAVATLFVARFDKLPELRTSHGVLVYLLLIIGASRQGGRWLSLVMVVLGYLAVDVLFVPLRFALGAAKDFDLLILIGFLITGVVISQLFAGLQRAVRLANERSDEVARLSDARVQLERDAAMLHDADALVQTALRSSEALLMARDVHVTWPTDVPLAVRCDFTLAPQVLGNLRQNAARCSPPGTPIDVTVVPGTHLTEIVVADRGPGVSDTDLERMFAPLNRRTSPCDAQQERMGVGLSIARTFARAQRGDVRYRARDGGSEFVLVVATASPDDVDVTRRRWRTDCAARPSAS